MDTTRGSTLPANRILDLPLPNRSVNSLALLTVGVSSDPTSANGVGFAVNGNRARTTNFVVDGVDATDSYASRAVPTGTDVARTRPDLVSNEALSQFRIQTNFDSDAGSNSGGVVDLTIKSGSNNVHGTAFGSFIDEKLNARDFFDAAGSKNKHRNDDFGGSFGGPFKKNKAWWFFAYDGRRERKETPTLLAVPTNIDFSQAIMAVGGNPAIPLVQNPVV